MLTDRTPRHRLDLRARSTSRRLHVRPTPQGTLVFSRSASNTSLVAHWGELTTVPGQRSGAIWTLQSNGLACLLGDRVPSTQPTLGQLAASLATIPADNPFQRRIP